MHVKDIYQIVNNDVSGNGIISNGVGETDRQGNLIIYFYFITSEWLYILHFSQIHAYIFRTSNYHFNKTNS